MKLHEYQAKDVLKQHGIPVADGRVVAVGEDPAPVIAAVQQASGNPVVVVKAQVHAGGRGKAGGVKVCPDAATALAVAQRLLGSQLVTHQTGPQGVAVRRVYIGAVADIASEFYLAITLDRSRDRHVIIASAEGGVEIEEVARRSPEKIYKEWVDPAFGLRGYQTRRVIAAMGVPAAAQREAQGLLTKLYQVFLKSDATLAEINPLVLTKQGQVLALDAKLAIDDNALYRHPTIAALHDADDDDPAEAEAAKATLNYIKLDGKVGCMVNGAGLAMATMDIIKLKGGEPANFLDVGGGANVETVRQGFRIILSDPNVKAVLINIFGGIVRCDRIANGVIAAVRELDLKVPVVVRLEGTNAPEAKRLLAESGVALVPAGSLDDAAAKVVALSQGAA